MRILIVDDDKNQHTLFEDEAKSMNRKLTKEQKIKVVSKMNLKDAEELLKNDQNFDGAIVDMRINKRNKDDSSGNMVVKAIHDKCRFPVRVYSSYPEDFNLEIEESAFFKKYKKASSGNGAEIILNDLTQVYRSGITKVLGRRGKIEKSLVEIFWNNISNSMEYWMEHQDEASLARYVMLHVLDRLEINDTGDFGDFKVAEFYITPPIKQQVFTGDLISIDATQYIVLTPACDMVRRAEGKAKAERVLLGELRDLSDVAPRISKDGLNGELSRTLKGKMKEFVENKNPRFHCLPKYGDLGGKILDFQALKSFSLSELEELQRGETLKRVATISYPFLKDILARFSNYYGRQGAPGIENDPLYLGFK